MSSALRWAHPGLTPAAVIAAAAWCALVIAGMALASAGSAPGWGPATPCLLRQVTGAPCPTCGGTRAAAALVDGRVGAALALNPLVTVGLVAGPALVVWARLRRERLGLGWWMALGGVVMANWGYVAWAGVV